MLDKYGCRHVLEICNIYCVAMSNLVSRTRPFVTLIRTLPVSFPLFYDMLRDHIREKCSVASCVFPIFLQYQPDILVKDSEGSYCAEMKCIAVSESLWCKLQVVRTAGADGLLGGLPLAKKSLQGLYKLHMPNALI